MSMIKYNEASSNNYFVFFPIANIPSWSCSSLNNKIDTSEPDSLANKTKLRCTDFRARWYDREIITQQRLGAIFSYFYFSSYLHSVSSKENLLRNVPIRPGRELASIQRWMSTESFIFREETHVNKTWFVWWKLLEATIRRYMKFTCGMRIQSLGKTRRAGYVIAENMKFSSSLKDKKAISPLNKAALGAENQRFNLTMNRIASTCNKNVHRRLPEWDFVPAKLLMLFARRIWA